MRVMITLATAAVTPPQVRFSDGDTRWFYPEDIEVSELLEGTVEVHDPDEEGEEGEES